MDGAPILHPLFVRNVLMRGVFLIIFLIGGSKAQLARLKRLYPRALFVVIDNQREIQLLRDQFSTLDIRYFVLGDGETSRSLHEASIPNLRSASQRSSNANMLMGFGARLENAAKAAEVLMKTPDFQAFLASLIDEALERTQGRLTMSNVVVYGSSCGAGNAGTAIKFANTVAQQLACMKAPIQMRFDTLGAISFAGATNRGRGNAAQFLLRLVAYALRFSRAHELRVAKSICLHEIVPTGIDRDTRNMLVTLDAVAMDCVQMQEHLAQPQPNREQDDEFGAILSRDVDFCRPLDRFADIAQAAAKMHHDEISDAMKKLSRDLSAVDELVFDESESRPCRRSSVADVLDDVLEANDAEEILQAIERPEREMRLTMRATSIVSSDCVFERLAIVHSQLLSDLDSYIARMELYLGYEVLIGRKLADIEADVSYESPRLARIRKKLEVKTRKAMRKGRYLRDSWTHRMAEQFRTLSDQLRKLNMERDATLRALAAVTRELTALRNRLEAVQAILSSFVPRDAETHSLSAVVIARINSVFPKLMTLESLNEQQRIDLLCESAVQCSIAGLGHIVQSSSDRLDEIAGKIVHGEYPVIGPSHGAQFRVEPTQVVYALPPLEPKAEEALSQMIKQLAPDAAVVFYDSVALGASVMRFSFRRFRSVQSLFDGMMGRDLAESLYDERAALNGSNSWEIVRALGGRTQGDLIVFDGQVDYDAISQLEF